jgi:hypothetical protein
LGPALRAGEGPRRQRHRPLRASRGLMLLPPCCRPDRLRILALSRARAVSAQHRLADPAAPASLPLLADAVRTNPPLRHLFRLTRSGRSSRSRAAPQRRGNPLSERIPRSTTTRIRKAAGRSGRAPRRPCCDCLAPEGVASGVGADRYSFARKRKRGAAPRTGGLASRHGGRSSRAMAWANGAHLYRGSHAARG